MRIVARSRDRSMPINPGVRSHIMRRMRFALGPVLGRVPRIYVWVGDENGPRGGTDKFCSVRAEVEGHAPVFVRDCHADLYAAISLAAARTGRAVLRTVQRHDRVDRHRGELREPPTEALSITEGGLS
jgi:putative sigma-54 modulation protein